MSEIEKRLRRAGSAAFPDAAAAAAERFVAGAAAGNLADISYAEVDSPFGPLLLAGTRRGLVRLAYPDQTPDEVLQDLARRLSPRLLEAPGRLDDARRQLDRYFARKLRGFELPIDLALTHGFFRKVLRATARIPYGELSTYRLVASRAGNARASRAAGNALGSNPIPIVVPCHRVVHSSGGLGGYTGGLDRKRFLLRLEGAEVG